MKGVLSQGLLMSFNNFPSHYLIDYYYNDGNEKKDDVTELLNIKLYDPPIPACISGYAKGLFPSFIHRTNQERIQNHPEYFELYKDIEFEVTEKLHGTSITYYWNNAVFGVCSHNLELKDNDNTPWKIARLLKLPERLQTIGANIALQGELIGEGIQKNHYRIKGQQWYLFDIWDINNKIYFAPKERLLLLKELNDVFTENQIKHVPICFSHACFRHLDMDGFIEEANERSILLKDVRIEGIVYKSCDYINNEIISFKVLNNEYLLKE
jgi:RNA ligase (TIGR02306 family)